MNTRKPEYLRIYETLRGEIVSGVYAFGSKLPSKRDLADRHGVSVITVEHAYAMLAEEGYLQARQRSGYFVSYEETDHFAAPAASMPGVVMVPEASASTLAWMRMPLFSTLLMI